MNERPFYEDSLQEKALRVVGELREVAKRHERFFSPDIEAVLVFTGEEEWLHRMDHDRIRAGVGVVREVTAAHMKAIWGEAKGHKVSQDQIALHGPYFVYSGEPEENEVLRIALKSDPNKLPVEKIVIINEVKEDEGTRHSIGHTGEQFKSFFEEITKPDSPIYRVKNVALVGHYSDFVTYPFYAGEFNRRLRESGFEGLNFWAYGIKNRLGTGEELEKEELHRLVEFATHGGIVTEPLTFRVSQSDKELLT